MEIMVLDDEPIVGKRLKPALAKIGFNVETFEDPQLAIQRIDEKEFDIIVTDVIMGEISGIDVLDRARQKSSRTKVIMITAYAMISLAREAMDKGAFDFLAKPFSPDELREVVLRAAKELDLEVEADKGEKSPASRLN